MSAAAKSQGFTLIELVVAIAISSVVLVFVTMFIAAPIDAYELSSRRNVLTTEAAAAWPRMRDDLMRALPNSVRTRRNGNYVALEMLNVQGVSRYATAMGASFTASGTAQGVFSNTPAALTNNSSYYLSVNNRGAGVAGADAYTLSGSITATRRNITFTTNALTGEGAVSVTGAPVPAFTTPDSPRRRVYLVTGPVTFLCDEAQGTLRRYDGYAISANQTSRDAPNEFAGATNVLIARGLTTCAFSASGSSTTHPQTVSVRLTTTRNGESLTLLHSSRLEYAP
jgi:MSHA biogenesis protein MshO